MYDEPTVRARVPAADTGEPTRTMPPDWEAGDRSSPSGPEPERTVAGWRRPVAVVAAIAAVLVGVAAGLAFSDDSGSDSVSAPTASEAPKASVASPTSTLDASTLGSLFLALAEDPDDFGPRGRDLRDRLATLVDRRALTAAERDELLSEIAVWVQRRELDPEVGPAASRLVAAIPTVSVPTSTDGNGDDNRGRGDDDDDDG